MTLSLFQQVLEATPMDSLLPGVLGPEIENLMVLRKNRIFFGDLFRPQRRVLFGLSFTAACGSASVPNIEDQFPAQFVGRSLDMAQGPEIVTFTLEEMASLRLALGQEMNEFVSSYKIALLPEINLSELFELCSIGLDGGLCNPRSFDLAGLQYFTEWCRDLKFSPLWLIEDADDAAKVKGTDAPYAAFVFDESVQSENEFIHLVRLRRSLSPDFRVACFHRGQPENRLVRLAQVKFDCFIEL